MIGGFVSNDIEVYIVSEKYFKVLDFFLILKHNDF